MAPAIETHGLGKQYRIKGVEKPEDSLLKRGWRMATVPFEHLRRVLSAIPDEHAHWAVRDNTLTIEPGEVVSLIGRNGAGKTTLLKLLARLTAPTVGRAVVRGRVASMLELGTGFHLDLTGRENVFINGQIQGMSRAEVTRKLDAIVDFAGVERFLDTQVRFYSSGMSIRLAMGVSVHLSAEILLVDEVLSVADVGFREKALAKIRDVASDGRTVLFVSHNVNSILQLCTRGVLLDSGQVIDDGPAADIVKRYLAGSLDITAERIWPERTVAPGFADADPDAVSADVLRLRGIRARVPGGDLQEVYDVRAPVAVEVDFEVLERRFAVAVVLTFEDGLNRPIFVTCHDRGPDAVLDAGRHTVRAMVPGDLLNEGRIEVSVRIESRPGRYALEVRSAIAFEVTDRGDPEGARGPWTGAWPDAALRPRIAWESDPPGPL